MNKVKLTIGDWSQDGHNQYEEFVFESNKTVTEIRQAYKDSCKLTGLSFNHNQDYTGLNIGYGSDRRIATEYEEYELSNLSKEIFDKFNINYIEYEKKPKPENFVNLLNRVYKIT